MGILCEFQKALSLKSLHHQKSPLIHNPKSWIDLDSFLIGDFSAGQLFHLLGLTVIRWEMYLIR